MGASSEFCVAGGFFVVGNHCRERGEIVVFVFAFPGLVQLGAGVLRRLLGALSFPRDRALRPVLRPLCPQYTL